MTSSADLRSLHGVAGGSGTFLGLEPCTDLEAISAPIALLGVPCATPYPTVGAYCRNGPDALRHASGAVASGLDRFDFEVGGTLFPEPGLRAVDCGNLPCDEANPAGNREAIRTAVRSILARDAVPVLLGGDDSVPIPMLQALGDATPGTEYTVLQIDAHIDWRDVHMGERWGLSSTMRRASEMPHVKRIIQVGARGTGSAMPGDHEDAVAWGVTFITAHDLHRRGVAAALDHITPGSHLAVCIDADALDPALVPGVIGRAPGGLSYHQVADLVRGAAARGRIAAMDFVEFMPERDVDGIGALTFARLVATALGVVARQASGGPVQPGVGDRHASIA